MEFKNITKIIGPGGKEVSKITRTADNVILWQKPATSVSLVDSNGTLKNWAVYSSDSTSSDVQYGQTLYTVNTSSVMNGKKFMKMLPAGGGGDPASCWIYFEGTGTTHAECIGKTLHIDYLYFYYTEQNGSGDWTTINPGFEIGIRGIRGSSSQLYYLTTYYSAGSYTALRMNQSSTRFWYPGYLLTNVEITIPTSFVYGGNTYTTSGIYCIGTTNISSNKYCICLNNVYFK